MYNNHFVFLHPPSNFYSIWFSSLPPLFLIFLPSPHLPLHSLWHLLLSSYSSLSSSLPPLSFSPSSLPHPSLSFLLSLSVPLFPYTPHYQFISSQQLAPTVQGSESAHENGLEQTLFERLAFMVRSPCVCVTQSIPLNHWPVFNSTFLKLFFSFSFIYSCFVYYHFVYSTICFYLQHYDLSVSLLLFFSLPLVSSFLSLFFFPLFS